MLTENKAPTLVYSLQNSWIKASKTASNDAENKNRVYLSNFNRLEQEKKKDDDTYEALRMFSPNNGSRGKVSFSFH